MGIWSIGRSPANRLSHLSHRLMCWTEAWVWFVPGVGGDGGPGAVHRSAGSQWGRHSVSQKGGAWVSSGQSHSPVILTGAPTHTLIHPCPAPRPQPHKRCLGQYSGQTAPGLNQVVGVRGSMAGCVDWRWRGRMYQQLRHNSVCVITKLKVCLFALQKSW